MTLQILPATAERFEDVAALLRPAREDAPACWCLAYRVTSAEFSALRGEARPARLRQLCTGDPAPGLIAYGDGLPIGWCALGPRSQMGRLTRSRTIPVIDDLPVWSIVCFVVRVGFRRQGVAAALLDAAIGYATDCAATTLEAYPVDTGGGRISGAFAYVGTTGMFERAGFHRVVQTSSTSAGRPRWLMRRQTPA